MPDLHLLAAAAGVISFRVPTSDNAFTSRDLIELEAWRGPGRSLTVEKVRGQGTPIQYAALYEGDAPWASWAICRQGSALLLWDCVTLADIGRFRSVQEALAALAARQRMGEPALAKPPASAGAVGTLLLRPCWPKRM